MRKLLLASAAILGATGGIAFAQNPSQGQLAAPWAAGPAANNNNNLWGIARPGVDAVPTPGTVVVRLNGRVHTEVGAYFTSGDKSIPTGTGAIAGGGSFKVNPIIMNSYLRLYPGVDGMATNGLRYGASAEIRENVGNPNNATAFTAASSPSGYSNSETLFVRRAFVYVGSDKLGILRIGQTDGVNGLFDNGTYTSQTWDAGIGNFNGGALQSAAPNAGVAIPFVWQGQAGSEYTNTKIVYLTPQFFGFDFGVQYAPNMGNSFSNSLGASTLQAGACNAAGAGCIGTTTGNDPTRWLNQVAVGARYEGKIGGVNLGAFAVYQTAGKEAINGGGIAAGGPGYVAGTTPVGSLRYDNLNFVNAAVKVEVPSVGLTWATAYVGGAMNGSLAMRPTGGAPMNAVMTGLVYRNGPWVFGAEVGIVESQGQANLTKISQRKETEFAFGGTYNAAPGLAFAAEFMHTERHQGQFDFVTASTATGTRDAKGNGVVFATIVTW